MKTRQERTGGMRAVTGALAAVLMLSVFGGDARSETSGAGVQWRQMSLDEALAEAEQINRLVMIDFWAHHCASCGQMDIDLWETPAGAELTADLIPLKIDNGSQEGRAAVARYPVTGLPTVLFLLPDGTELDRIEGYQAREAFLRAARPLAAGVDPLPLMEARLADRPDSLALLYEIFDRYLNRKRNTEAEALFSRILELDPSNRRMAAEKALRRMARHHEYSTADFARAAGYWAQLVEQFPQSSSVGAGVRGVHKMWRTLGRAEEWLPWICGIVEKHGEQRQLLTSAVYTGLDGGFSSPCLAEAARAAAVLEPRRAAFMDSVAVLFDPGSKGGR